MNTAHLSPREREIARLICKGLTDRQIAARLFISVRTVEGHIYRARIKLDATDRYELARTVWGDAPRKCLYCGSRSGWTSALAQQG